MAGRARLESVPLPVIYAVWIAVVLILIRPAAGTPR